MTIARQSDRSRRSLARRISQSAQRSGAAIAADECKEVRVMVTAGPEEDVLIKYAKSDFEQQTGITAAIETVSRDLWPARAAREFTDGTGRV